MLVTHTKDLTSAQKHVSTMVSGAQLDYTYMCCGLRTECCVHVYVYMCTCMFYTGNRIGPEKSRQTQPLENMQGTLYMYTVYMHEVYIHVHVHIYSVPDWTLQAHIVHVLYLCNSLQTNLKSVIQEYILASLLCSENVMYCVFVCALCVCVQMEEIEIPMVRGSMDDIGDEEVQIYMYMYIHCI